jgi:integrase
VADVITLANTVPDRYRALILTMAGLGLRIGEATGLTLDRLDFTNGHVVIDRQLVTPGRGEPHFGPVKTRSSNRRLPLSDTVRDALALHLDTYGLGPDGLVFTSQRGRPLGRTTFGEVFRTASQALGLKATSHDLRHHCASLLIGAGCPGILNIFLHPLLWCGYICRRLVRSVHHLFMTSLDQVPLPPQR